MSHAGAKHPVAWTRDRAAGLAHRVSTAAGGREHLRVVLILAGVLALDGADKGAVSAAADNLQRVFGIDQTQIGLLVSAATLVGAAATLPVGMLTDRTNRTRLLAFSIAFWAAAQLVSGMAQSFLWLLIARMALGAVTATAGPTVASLIGDFFTARDRSRMYGYILAGELVGTGFGFLVSGELAAWFGWRYAFWWLVIPSVAMIWATHRLAEPSRGETGYLQASGERAEGEVMAASTVQEARVQPHQDLVLQSDPTRRSVWWAIKYVLRVRTNVVLILASALGYFYFSGLRTYALLFATDHYDITKSVASTLVLIVGIGALTGVIVGGRLADRLLRHSHIRARVGVPTVTLVATTIALAPAVFTTNLATALPLLTVGAGFLGAANPPLDAARLDIMHPRLWGRAEAVRTVLRNVGEAIAPVTFGFVSQHVFGGGGGGLTDTLLLMLTALLGAAALGVVGLRTYPADVATAAASIDRVQASSDGSPS